MHIYLLRIHLIKKIKVVEKKKVNTTFITHLKLKHEAMSQSPDVVFQNGKLRRHTLNILKQCLHYQVISTYQLCIN